MAVQLDLFDEPLQVHEELELRLGEPIRVPDACEQPALFEATDIPIPESLGGSEPFKIVNVHFETAGDLARFCSVIGCHVSGKTTEIWWPRFDRALTLGKRWAS